MIFISFRCVKLAKVKDFKHNSLLNLFLTYNFTNTVEFEKKNL